MNKEKIIELITVGKFSYRETAKNYNLTVGQIAGIIWRHKNPKLWKIGVPSGEKRRWYNRTRKHK